MSNSEGPSAGQDGLVQVLTALRSIQQTQADLVTAVDTLSQQSARRGDTGVEAEASDKTDDPVTDASRPLSDANVVTADGPLQPPAVPTSPGQRSSFTSRIILT